MSTMDLVVVLVLLVASGATVVVNLITAKRVSKVPGSWLRPALRVSAFLALVYHAAYWWLLIDPDSEWSRIMRPVGIIAWIAGPWMALPLAVRSNAHRLADHMVRQARDVLPEIGSMPDGKED